MTRLGATATYPTSSYPGLPELAPIAGVSNWKRANLSRAIAGFGAVKANSADCNVTIAGDSTTYGFGANQINGGANNAVAGSAWVQLAAALNAASIPASSANFFATGGTANITQLIAADTRMTLGGTGSGWSNASFDTVAGVTLGNSTDTTNTHTFTVAPIANTVDLYLMRYSGGGTIAWSVDGGSETTISLNNGTRNIGKFTISLGSNSAGHTVTLRVSATSAFVCGMVAYSTVTRRLNILGQGRGSALTDTMVVTAQGESWGNNLNVAGSKLVFVNCVLNDQSSRTDPTTSMNNLQTIINAVRAANSDIILVMPHPKEPSPATVQNAYLSAMQTLANTNNCPCLNLTSDYPFVTNWTAAAFDSGDSLHPNAAGYAYIASRYQALITSLWNAA